MTAGALTAAVMVARGRHPATDRDRVPLPDRRAIELACAVPGAAVTAVHAGALPRSLAYELLGLPLAAVEAIGTAAGADPLPALVAWWRERRPALTVFGARTEAGQGTGTLPFFFAEILGLPLIHDAVAARHEAGALFAIQTLGPAIRREWSVTGHLVVVASPGGSSTMPFSHARSLERRVEAVTVRPADDVAPWAPPDLVADRGFPASLRSDAGRSVEDRFSALIGGKSEAGGRIGPVEPGEAADIILREMRRLRLLAEESRP